MPKSGATGWYTGYHAPLYDSQGRIDGAIGIIHDITARKRMENALTTSLQTLEGMFEATPTLIAYLDTEFNFVRVNRAFAAANGETPERFPGENHFALHPDAENEAIFRRVLASGQAHSAYAQPFPGAHNGGRDGEYWDWTLTPVKDAEGRVAGLLLALLDVSERIHAMQALAESEQLLSATFDQAAVGIALVTPEGRWLRFNDRLCEIVGYSREQLRQRTFESITPAEFADTDTAQRKALLDGSLNRVRLEKCYLRSDGGLTWANVTASAVRDGDGRARYVISVIEDITPRKQAEERLRLKARIIETTSEAILVTDAAATIVDVNNACCAISGYAREELIGNKPSVLRSGRHDNDFYAAMWKDLTETGQWTGEIWDRRKNGEIYPKWLRINAVHGEQGQLTHYVAVFSDISTIKRAQEQLSYLAYYDVLTGLANRSLLVDRLSQAIVQAERHRQQVALLFVDLDRFKEVNDMLGHAVGDDVLRVVVKRMQLAVRHSDTVARLGGDEFVVVMQDIEGHDGVLRVIETILDALQQPIELAGNAFYTTASIGVSLYPQYGEDAETLMREADSAMYQAKTAGRNTYRFFSPELDQAARERFDLEAALRGALQREEFELHYQPQIHTETGAMIGVEALLRWRHPQKGLLLPGAFLHIAEESGLIVPIGEWTIKEACHRCRQWHEQGHRVRMAVNTSARQFRYDDLVGIVERALTDAGLPPGWLELEITESLLLHPSTGVLDILNALSKLGVWLAVDDFGTGYSSLSYLKRYPINQLKIDKSFVDGIATDANDRAIVEAIIALGRALQLDTLAEGVESAGPIEALRELGCAMMQGYHFGKPMPAAELTALLTSTPSGGNGPMPL